jgi:hypothetical protein
MQFNLSLCYKNEILFLQTAMHRSEQFTFKLSSEGMTRQATFSLPWSFSERLLVGSTTSVLAHIGKKSILPLSLIEAG